MNKLQWVILLSFVIDSFTATAQTPVATTASIIDRNQFFAVEQPVELIIETDYKKMKAQKDKGIYQNAVATMRLPDSEAITEPIRLYARGEYRRKNCQMPGLMLNFKNTTSPKLSGLKKVKLVCSCSSAAADEQLLLMEYLIYKIYNQLTDMSFKVRLAKVGYKDANSKIKPYTHYAFLLEDVDDMAKRRECKEVQDRVFFTEATNRQQMTIVALFQYMIGNTDWAVPNYHNVKLIRSADDTTSAPYVVPYDFDYTGLVNAPYAIPHPDLNIEKVTDRLYRGFPRSMDELQSIFQLFKKEKENMYAIIRNFEPLKKNKREGMIRYLEDFYDIIENKNLVQQIFIYGARKS